MSTAEMSYAEMIKLGFWMRVGVALQGLVFGALLMCCWLCLRCVMHLCKSRRVAPHTKHAQLVEATSLLQSKDGYTRLQSV